VKSDDRGPVIYRSKYPDPVIPDTTLTDYVLAHAGTIGDHAALVDGVSGETFTYADLARQVAIVAAHLATWTKCGDVVALVGPNQPAWPVAFYGALAAGSVVTAMSPQLTGREVVHQLRASRAVLVIADEAAHAAREAAAAVGVRVLDLATLASLAAEADQGVASGRECAEPGSAIAVLAYSSGTTGLPKGVLLTHRNLVASLCQHEGIYAMGRDDVVLAVLPFFHIFGMSLILSYALRHGATIVTLPRLDREQYLATIAARRATWLHMAPPLALLIANADDAADLSSVQHAMSGAAPLDAALAVRTARRLGCGVGQGYGMTEASPGLTWVPTDGVGCPAGSVGHLVPGTEARLVDPISGRDIDGPGELWIRGPQVMAGFLDDPAATKAAIDDDGWMRTGDLVRIDASGAFWVVDRLKEVIKYKGYQIAPAEIEAVLREHPLVDDAAVVGLPDRVAGEIPTAFVVRTDDSLTAAALLAWCVDRLAPYKKPREIIFVDRVPKSPSGKVLRRELRDAGFAAGVSHPA
jgi:acyl-CoA synthetase (AMP-forming)/AMP-acid ligase II